MSRSTNTYWDLDRWVTEPSAEQQDHDDAIREARLEYIEAMMAMQPEDFDRDEFPFHDDPSEPSPWDYDPPFDIDPEEEQ